jgi:hypothetical protein
MDIKFVWSTPSSTVLRDVIESNIRKDIEDDPKIHPCHSDEITVHLASNDPLETTIKGELKCQCGKVLENVSGASDGSRLTYGR